MPLIWQIYYVTNCRHATPSHNKFVVIVCISVKPMGFLINTGINPFIKNRPELLVCQVALKTSDYKCLHHDSYVNCNNLFMFEDIELSQAKDSINSKTKMAIKMAVSASVTIDRCYKKIILAKP